MTQASGAWDPAQYAKFAAERSEPFYDLLTMVEPRPDMSVVDLGCGSGELTAVIHERLRAHTTVGIDSSAAMLAEAPEVQPGLSFEEHDISEFAPGAPVDLVFSNAALQWLDNHAALFERMASWLTRDGQLAVQVPANFDHPSHTIAADIAGTEPFASKLGTDHRRPGVEDPAFYEENLYELGFERRHVRLQVYGHELCEPGDILEWMKGTLLTAYRKNLDDDTYAAFLDEYEAQLFAELPEAGPLLYPFKRILIWAAFE